MKAIFQILFRRTLLTQIFGLCLLTCLDASAQTFKVLYAFSPTVSGKNLDGSAPDCELALSNGILYGTTFNGGLYGFGAVFSEDEAGTSLHNLHSFTGGPDGRSPFAGLSIGNNVLYGTTVAGGSNEAGTVFSINLSNNGFTNIYSFTATTGNIGDAPMWMEPTCIVA